MDCQTYCFHLETASKHTELLNDVRAVANVEV